MDKTETDRYSEETTDHTKHERPCCTRVAVYDDTGHAQTLRELVSGGVRMPLTTTEVQVLRIALELAAQNAETVANRFVYCDPPRSMPVYRARAVARALLGHLLMGNIAERDPPRQAAWRARVVAGELVVEARTAAENNDPPAAVEQGTSP